MSTEFPDRELMTDFAEDLPPPAGFRRLVFQDGFVRRNGVPMVRLDDDGQPEFGWRVTRQVANPLGALHGGWIASMFDMSLAAAPRFTDPVIAERFLLTVNLTVDYLGGAKLGDWISGHATMLRRTKRLVFCQGLLSVDGDVIARGSGVFRIGPEFPPIKFED